jgi:DNA-binding NarL/FixJ family response regulator
MPLVAARSDIHKQEATTDVIEAIRRVLSGRIYPSEQETERALLAGAGIPGPGQPRPSVRDLSDRELEVFDLIGQCRSGSQIAEQLHLGVKTVDTHRAKIKRKLGFTSGSELIRYAVRWVLEQR